MKACGWTETYKTSLLASVLLSQKIIDLAYHFAPGRVTFWQQVIGGIQTDKSCVGDASGQLSTVFKGRADIVSTVDHQ